MHLIWGHSLREGGGSNNNCECDEKEKDDDWSELANNKTHLENIKNISCAAHDITWKLATKLSIWENSSNFWLLRT